MITNVNFTNKKITSNGQQVLAHFFFNYCCVWGAFNNLQANYYVSFGYIFMWPFKLKFCLFREFNRQPLKHI